MKKHETGTPYTSKNGGDGQKMTFKVLESKRGKLNGILEGEDLIDILDEIGDQCGIKSVRLKAFREMRNNDLEVYVILKGSAIIAEIKLIFGNRQTD